MAGAAGKKDARLREADGQCRRICHALGGVIHGDRVSCRRKIDIDRTAQHVITPCRRLGNHGLRKAILQGGHGNIGERREPKRRVKLVESRQSAMPLRRLRTIRRKTR